MFGSAPSVSLPNLPPLPGLPADIFQQAQQQQDKVLNLHLQRHRAMEEATKENAKENRLKQTRFVICITISTFRHLCIQKYISRTSEFQNVNSPIYVMLNEPLANFYTVFNT